MNKDLANLNKYAMNQFFNESKYPCHFDVETYEKNKAKISDIKMSLRALGKIVEEKV